MTATLEGLLQPHLAEGYIYLRPVLDGGGLIWTALYERRWLGEWAQTRGWSPDLGEALSECLQLTGRGVIPSAPIPHSTLHLAGESEADVSVAPPETWQLPTRMKMFANSGAPLSELLRGIHCKWCGEERLPEQLHLSWNYEFLCRDTKNCVHPSGRRQPDRPGAPGGTLPAATNGNGHHPQPRPANADTKSVETQEEAFRRFRCSDCGKPKRTSKMTGPLPERCSDCRKKKVLTS